MWNPINPTHSIESMTVAVTFAEPMSSPVYRKVIRELERTTNERGPFFPQVIKGLEINIQGDNQPALRQTNTDGMIFQKNSLVRDIFGVVTNRPVEQIELQRNRIAYSNMNYSNWNDVKILFGDLLDSSFELISEIVDISSIRIQYLDRFISEKDGNEVSAEGVIDPKSEYVSPHIFRATDLWHSHTGKFEIAQKDKIKRLLQVNIDAVDIALPGLSHGTRSITVLTAVEMRFLQPSADKEDIGSDSHSQSRKERLNELHSEVLDLYRKVLDEKMASRVGMK